MKTKLLIAALCALLGSNVSVFAAGNAAAGKDKSAMCMGCHGADGNSPADAFPSLAGQHADYLVKQMADFKAATHRNDPTMLGMVAALSAQDMEDLAAFYASQTGKAGMADEKQVALGKAIYRGGNISSGVPACMGCHSPSGAGNPGAKFPSLKGQHAKYTAKQLRDFRDNNRKNDAGKMMRNVALRMTNEEIEAVAQFIAGLK
ncbi:MAG: cytochrome c4 [Gammaproteobacteria bacterium]|nr:cytochrome c4 [Gammaproteobacteria bacterium]